MNNAEYFKSVVDAIDCSTLQSTVKEFFKCLDRTETSNHDAVFHPTEIVVGENETYIGSVRVLESAKMKKILKAMKEFCE